MLAFIELYKAVVMHIKGSTITPYNNFINGENDKSIREEDKAHLLSLITEEKKAYQEYVRLCQRYEIQPDIIATKVSSSRLKLLVELHKRLG